MIRKWENLYKKQPHLHHGGRVALLENRKERKERNKNLKDLHILRLTKIATATLYII